MKNRPEWLGEKFLYILYSLYKNPAATVRKIIERLKKHLPEIFLDINKTQRNSSQGLEIRGRFYITEPFSNQNNRIYE